MATNHLLSAPQNINVQSHYAGIPMPQPLQERLPPSYEEAQLAAQNADIQQISNMEAEKHAIYRHPLFPLLALLFEKCEQTTATCECPPCPAFDNEIKDYIIQHNREGKPFFTEDADLDTLVGSESVSSFLCLSMFFWFVRAQIVNIVFVTWMWNLCYVAKLSGFHEEVF